jgi:hypothetical protein
VRTLLPSNYPYHTQLCYHIQPISSETQSCGICTQPYSPNSRTEIMHFCPRKSCQIWYHEACLVENNMCADTDAIEDPKISRILISPNSNKPFAISPPHSPPAKRRKTGKNTKAKRRQDHVDSQTTLDALLRGLPSELVEAAGQPIVRGGLFGNLAGNIRHVLNARTAVYEALEAGGRINAGWKKDVHVAKAIVELPSEDFCFRCECGSII